MNAILLFTNPPQSVIHSAENITHDRGTMGRYRPPAEKSSAYITPQGYFVLQDELEKIWRHRAEVTKALAAAAAEGDRSENAEYIYRKKELRGIDRRIRYLQKRLPVLTVVHDLPADQSRIYFGAWITLEDVDGTSALYRIVGPDELDPGKGHISMDSPMARALLKKTLDDEVAVNTPHGEKVYYVVNIEYKSHH